MPKSVEFCQLARGINHTTWSIPRIRDGDKWRNIENTHLVENNHVHLYYHHYRLKCSK